MYCLLQVVDASIIYRKEGQEETCKFLLSKGVCPFSKIFCNFLQPFRSGNYPPQQKAE